MSWTLADLAHTAGRLVDLLLARYERATMTDFTMLAAAAIVTCWFLSKYASD